MFPYLTIRNPKCLIGKIFGLRFSSGGIFLDIFLSESLSVRIVSLEYIILNQYKIENACIVNKAGYTD